MPTDAPTTSRQDGDNSDKKRPARFRLDVATNGGFVLEDYSRGGYLAAFTDATAMIEWLAAQYGVDIGTPRYGVSPAMKLVMEPKTVAFSWSTRQDFIAALTAALCVTSKPNAYDHDEMRPAAPMSPADHARRVADVLQTLKNAAPPATTSVVKQWSEMPGGLPT